jgi:glycosyltransferase involved in cell wall biosynthesis
LTPESPFFSVVLPTYGRGIHIRPTLESALGQTYQNFELIVVGDGCSDETEETVRSFQSNRIRWYNLAQNSGSQSFPNNQGIDASRGRWIAYLGHDDVWDRNHLKNASKTIESFPDADIIIAGCIFYGPPESDIFYITGLFESNYAPLKSFFPPTSIVHRHEVTDIIGKWRDPRSLQMPVDCDFLLRAAQVGLRFTSTGKITVHKFAAGHRYLSYLEKTSNEQKEVLAKLLSPQGVNLEEIIRRSKTENLFMSMKYGDFSSFAKGFLFEQNRKNKGIIRPSLRPLRHREVILQRDDPRALDWHPLEKNPKPFRWSGPNPKPKILIPFHGNSARITIQIFAINPALRLKDLKVYLGGLALRTKVVRSLAGIKYLVFDVSLKNDDYTVLCLDAPTFQPCAIDRLCPDLRRLGIAVGDIIIEPVKHLGVIKKSSPH